MSSNVLLPSEIDLSTITFHKKPSKKSICVIIVKHCGEPLYIELPKMRLPFGLTSNAKFVSGDDKLKYDLRFSLDIENEKVCKLKKILENLNDLFIQKCMENSEDWINDAEPTLKSINKSYGNPIKINKNKKYSDTLKINVPYYNGNISNSVEIYTSEGEETGIENIVPGCSAKSIVDLSTIWCSSGLGRFGITPKLVQLQIFDDTIKKIKGFSIREN